MMRLHLTLFVIGELALIFGSPHAPKPPKVVEAERFVLRDAHGKVRVELGLVNGEPRLTLFDAKGKPRTVLFVDKDGEAHLGPVDNGAKHAKKINAGEKSQPKSVPTIVPVTPEEQSRLYAAGVVYRKMCQSCHAADGKGTKSKARSGIPDFSDPVWHKSRTDAQLLAGILNGRGNEMPPFDDQLRSEQARDLVVFVRTFASHNGAQPASSDFQKRLRELQQQLEELNKQIRELQKPPVKDDGSAK